MKIGGFELHPACVLLPPLGPEEFRELRASIARLGQIEPIARWERDGTILDGRNRLMACLDLGIEPRIETIAPDDPWEWIWAQNIDRRHIEAGRRCSLRLEFDHSLRKILEQASQAAADRKTRGLRRGPVRTAEAPEDVVSPAAGDEHPEFHEMPFPDDDEEELASVREVLPIRGEGDERTASGILATAGGATTKTAGKAIKLYKERPDLHTEVCAGRLSLDKADRERRRGGMEDAWKAHEAYYTPAWVVELLVGSGFLSRPRLAVEPCVGDGSIVRALRGFCSQWITMDIRDVEPAHDGMHITGSWLEAAKSLSKSQRRELAKADLLITNSAFKDTQQVVEAGWELCPNAQIWILQRRTWHDEARAEWFADHQPDECNVSPRIRFLWPNGKPVGGGTDNCIHAWYGFAAGADQPCIGPNGGITRTLTWAGEPDPGDGE
jgi:hypothetical protein